MENVITSLIIIGVLILAILGLSERSFATQAIISESSQLMQERVAERSRTALTSVGAATDGNQVQVTLKNTGSTKLADWSHWDVMLQYSNGGGNQLSWYPNSAGTGTWSQQILMSTSPLVAEVIEPGILNPGEYLVIQVDVSANPVGAGTTNQATIVAPNGVSATAIFTH